jgi:transposase InsO family protein
MGNRESLERPWFTRFLILLAMLFRAREWDMHFRRLVALISGLRDVGSSWNDVGVGYKLSSRLLLFKNHGLPDNLPALAYLPNLAHAPHSISKWPDILSASIGVAAPNGQEQPVVSLHVAASDVAYSSAPTARQAVAEVRVFLNTTRPHQSLNGNPPLYLQLELSPSGADSDVVTGSLSIAV